MRVSESLQRLRRSPMALSRYKQLAKHPGIWRVDGIAPIRPDAALGARTSAYLSRLTPAGAVIPYDALSRDGETTTFHIHIASLRHFKVGSIWRDGMRIKSPPVIKTRYHVDVRRARTVKLHEHIVLDGRNVPTVLPEDQFALDRNRMRLSQTLYVIVPVMGDPQTQWMVIPCSELLRFYFGASTRLLSDTARGRLDRYVDWDKSRIENGKVTLRVKRALTRKELTALARAKASTYAGAALMGVHQHLAVTSTNNKTVNRNARRHLVIKAAFPFSTPTRLAIAGKRISLAPDKSVHAVFAMEILACSHPAEFSEIEWEGDGPSPSGGVAGEHGASGQPRFHPELRDDKVDPMDLNETPADARLRRGTILNFVNHFSGYRDVKFKRENLPSRGKYHSPGADIDVPVSGTTLEDGNYSNEAKGNLGINEHDNTVEHTPRRLAVFITMLGHLRQATADRKWSLTLKAPVGGLTNNGEPIASFPDKVRKRYTWNLVVEPSGNVRPRQVVWVEVATRNHEQIFYILEMELRPSEDAQCTALVYLDNFSELDDVNFNKLLTLTTIKHYWPEPHSKWEKSQDKKEADELFSDMKLIKLRHPAVSDNEDEKNKNTGEAKAPKKIDPEAWSKSLLEMIDAAIPLT